MRSPSARADSKEAHLGLDHTDLVPSLLNLGDVLVAALEFTPAIVVTERAVALSEARPDPTASDVARALTHLGNALGGARRHDDAVQTLERSLRLHEKTLAETDVAIARTLEDLGRCCSAKGTTTVLALSCVEPRPSRKQPISSTLRMRERLISSPSNCGSRVGWSSRRRHLSGPWRLLSGRCAPSPPGSTIAEVSGLDAGRSGM